MKRKDWRMLLISLVQVSLMVLNSKEILCQMKRDECRLKQNRKKSKDLLYIEEHGYIGIEKASRSVNTLTLKRMNSNLIGMNCRFKRRSKKKRESLDFEMQRKD